MKQVMLALTLVGVLAFTLGAAAAANPRQGGATVVDVDTCALLIGGGTVCVTAKGIINEVETPSGNENYVTNYRERIWVLDGDQIVWDETSVEHFHALTLDGVLQEMSWRARFTITNVGQPFCVQYHIHGTNGTDQFVRID